MDTRIFAAEASGAPSPAMVDALLRTGFSAEAYRDACGDLRDAHMTTEEAISHYLRHGIFEARRFPFEVNQYALLELAQFPFRSAGFKAQLLADVTRNLLKDLAQPFGPGIAERWAAISGLMHHGARPYFVVGDSHSTQYVITDGHDGEWLLPIHMLCHAGSARGLGNPNSTTGYGEQLRQSLGVIRSLPGACDLPFLIQFGQVDIEFVHHFHRVRDNKRRLDLDAYLWFCSETVFRYTNYLASVFPAPNRNNAFVLSVFPPALSDEAWRGGKLNDVIVRVETGMTQAEMAAGIRLLDVANLKQRTAVHRSYNIWLHNACESYGFRYIDVFSPFLGPDGLIDQKYLNPEAYGFDHHLDLRRTHPVVADLIWRIMRKETFRAG